MKYNILKFKFIYLGTILFALLTISCKTSDTRNVNKEGFVKIFDGKTMQGWKGDPVYWRVENGNMVGEVTAATPLEHNKFIIWQGGQPANFELKVDFRITKDGNSGINYRSVALDDISFALKGYQADIDGQNKYTGQNYEERGRTTLAYRGEKVIINTPDDLSESLMENVKNNAWTKREVTGLLGDRDSLAALIKKEDWNTIHLVVNGNRIQHYVNGVLMSDVTDNDTVNRKFSGKLGMQVHVGPAMKVEYRNLLLKEL
jgi:hypothetical protein